MDRQELAVLLAVDKLVSPTPSQIFRFLFDSGLEREFDSPRTLSRLREDGLLEQGVSTGITYSLTEGGLRRLKEGLVRASADIQRQYEAAANDYRVVFEREKDYIALYTEQSNGIFPMFLSIRRKDKILMQVNIIVQNEASAKAIAKAWTDRANGTYDAVWDSIAHGLDLQKPEFS
ncbi:MAG: DUF4364 family protein [Oscillospiraceae bacterium]|jgi:DNA-binding PadR family transcriptional regulator|nr:DUF4364 family protein [Oscillospiraceae bacterium]